MLTFLFEQYGYYPTVFENNTFIINGWEFRLLEVNCDKEYIDEICGYLETIKTIFSGKGAFIIKTRFNEKISFYDNKRYVLISVFKQNMSLMDLNKFHCCSIEAERRLSLNDLLHTWKMRMENIEENSINSLRVDSVSYKNNLEICMFCFGLAQNAVQYLSEVIIDYGLELDNLTIVHRRIINLNSFDFFNPFNMIVDHPIKDLAELYKNDYMSFSEFVEIIKYYELNSKVASVLMARILYPVCILDLLEDNVYKKNLKFSLKYNVEKEFNKIKKMYSHLKREYNIRPIDWLEN